MVLPLSPWLCHFLLLVICLLICGKTAHSSAWMVEKHTLEQYITGLYYESDKYNLPRGGSQSHKPYQKFELNNLLQYGAYDWLTIGAEIRSRHVDYYPYDDERNFQLTSLGKTDIFAKFLLWEGSHIDDSLSSDKSHKNWQNQLVSVEPKVIIPAPKNIIDSTAAYDERDPEVAFAINYGYAMSFNDELRENDPGIKSDSNYVAPEFVPSAFIDSSLEYRHRTGRPSDQVRGKLVLGYKPYEKWIFMLENQAIYRLHKQNTEYEYRNAGMNYDLWKTQLSAAYQITPKYAVQFGGFYDVYSRNTGQGAGVLFSIWVKENIFEEDE